MTHKKTGNFKLRVTLGTLIIVCVVLVLGACDNGFVEAIEKDIAAELPEMEILVDGAELTGDSYDFQEQILGTAKTVDIVFKNMGEVPLVFQDPQYVLNPNPGDEGIFEISDFNASAVQAGDSFTCSFDFTPDSERAYSASITIYSNDPDTPEYTFSVTGTGYVPSDGLFYVNNNDSYSNSTTVNLNMNFSEDPDFMRFSNTSGGLSSASWEPYSDTRSGWSLESGADGSRTVYAQFQDSLGFVTDKQDSITLDSTPPTGAITSINSGAVYTSSRTVTLSLSASDGLSGISKMRFSSSNTISTPSFTSSWLTYQTGSSYSIPTAEASGDGVKYIFGQFQDTAGNISTSLIWNSITLDTVAPTGSISVDGGATYATSRSVTLTLSASDTTSNVKSMRFSDSSSSTQPDMSAIPWKTYSTSSSYNITSSNDGNKYVFAQYQDNAGKISTATISDSITLDTTDPSGYISISYGDSFTNTTKVRIDLSHVSGATQMSFSGNISPISLRSYSSYIDVTLTSGEGNKTINGYFKDVAGNDVTLSDSIYLNVFTISHTESTGTGLGGTSVDISPNGDVVAIGIPDRSWMKQIPGTMMFQTLTRVGAFSVLRKSGSTWSGDGGLQHDGLSYSNFGYSVSVSPSGNYISVGAPNDGANTSSTYGKIYRYYYSGGSWTLSSTISGSSSYDTGLTVLDTDSYRYYKDSSSGNTYIKRYGGTLKQSYSHTYARRDLDGSGAGTSDLIVWGSPFINNSRGYVYVYDRLLSYKCYIWPSDAEDNQRFGNSVAISSNAQTIVASNDVNEAYIFQGSGASWTQRQKITKPADAGISFAPSVAVSEDGNTVVLGCPSYNSWKGAVYIYVKRPQDNTWELVNRYSLGGTVSAHFGDAVAISDDGSTIVVGAPTGDSSSSDSKVYILE